MGAYSLNHYSIPDLLRLLQSQRGERILLESGCQPMVSVKGEKFEIDGPELTEEMIEGLLRDVAGTRDVRTFRECGTVDVLHEFENARFLIRALRAFQTIRLELQNVSASTVA